MSWSEFNGMTSAGAIFQSGALILALVLIVWLFSIPRKDVSIIDTWFAVIMTAAVLLAALTGDGYAPRQLAVLLPMGLWCLRITAYMLWRKAGAGEDPRYTVLRRKAASDAAFVWRSLQVVFLFQGAVFLVTILPAQFAVSVAYPEKLGFAAYAGLALWLIGFYFEAWSDWQLIRFRRDPANRGRLLDTGLWRYSRHPNYFGELCMAWSYFVIALDNPLALYTIVGPLLYSCVVINITGKRVLDHQLKRDKPGYADYMARTSGLIPWFPRPANQQTASTP